MLLSIITVAFRNLEGIVKTHASLAHLAQVEDISFEWIVVDGGSNDGTREYLENLNGIFNLRFVSESDNGIYDAMNKGIAMAQGKFALFLNSGDIFHQNAANFVRKLKMQKDNVMITGDALLDFGDGHKIKRSAKPGWYIYHSLPASHQAIFFPVSGLKKWRYDLEYKVSSDYALAAKMYKAGYAFKNSMAWCLNFPWVGYLPPIIWNCVLTRKKSNDKYYMCLAFGLNYPGIYANVLPQRRKPYITKSEYKENQCKI